jgi:hypothetical protein
MKMLALSLAILSAIGLVSTAFAQNGEMTDSTNSNPGAYNIAIAEDLIQRGSTQSISAELLDSNGQRVANTATQFTVTYAGGLEKTLDTRTDETGFAEISFEIGGNSNTGTFTVDVRSPGNSQHTSDEATFEVVEAS